MTVHDRTPYARNALSQQRYIDKTGMKPGEEAALLILKHRDSDELHKPVLAEELRMAMGFNMPGDHTRFYNIMQGLEDSGRVIVLRDHKVLPKQVPYIETSYRLPTEQLVPERSVVQYQWRVIETYDDDVTPDENFGYHLMDSSPPPYEGQKIMLKWIDGRDAYNVVIKKIQSDLTLIVKRCDEQ